MPRVSGREVKNEERLIGRFWTDINSLSSDERMSYFEHLLTPTEVVMLAKRAAIFKDLITKKSYNEISGNYKVGVNTISRLSNTLHQALPDFIVILTKLSSHDGRKGIFG